MKVAVRCSIATLGLAMLAPSLARADGDVAATALFDDGRRLMAEHKYADACPKLAESQRLAPSGGTLLNLGDCYEHTGQTASAWGAWKEAAARANAAGKAQIERMALDRAAALEPKLARLSVAIAPGSDVPGLQIKRDGVVLGEAEYGLAIPVDPGTHLVEATAPKKQPWSGQIDVAPKQADARVTVALNDEVAAPVAAAPVTVEPGQSPPPREQPSASDGNGQRAVAIVTLGVGAVGIVIGSVFGLEAKSKNDQAEDDCPTNTTCTQTGLSLTSDARSAATISTVSFAVGAAAVAGGIVIWLTAPSAGGVHVSPTANGALLTGTF